MFNGSVISPSCIIMHVSLVIGESESGTALHSDSDTAADCHGIGLVVILEIGLLMSNDRQINRQGPL